MDDRIKIKRLSHVTFAHLEVDYTRQFLLDFGLTEVSVVGNKHYFRGYGDLPYVYVLEAITEGQAAFRAAAFEVESHDELDKASKLQVSSRSHAAMRNKSSNFCFIWHYFHREF